MISFKFGRKNHPTNSDPPDLLDALHPLITLRLFFCSQLQWFLSIMAEDDLEIVLSKKKKKKIILLLLYVYNNKCIYNNYKLVWHGQS